MSKNNKEVEVDCQYCGNTYSKPHDTTRQTLRCPECLYSTQNPVWDGEYHTPELNFNL